MKTNQLSLNLQTLKVKINRVKNLKIVNEKKKVALKHRLLYIVQRRSVAQQKYNSDFLLEKC